MEEDSKQVGQQLAESPHSLWRCLSPLCLKKNQSRPCYRSYTCKRACFKWLVLWVFFFLFNAFWKRKWRRCSRNKTSFNLLCLLDLDCHADFLFFPFSSATNSLATAVKWNLKWQPETKRKAKARCAVQGLAEWVTSLREPPFECHSCHHPFPAHQIHSASVWGRSLLPQVLEPNIPFICLHLLMYVFRRQKPSMSVTSSHQLGCAVRPSNMSGCQAFDLLICTLFTSCELLVFVSIHSTCQLKQGYKVCAVYTAAFGSQPRLLLEAVVFSAWLKPPATVCGAGGTLLLSFFSSAYFPLLLSSQQTRS